MSPAKPVLARHPLRTRLLACFIALGGWLATAPGEDSPTPNEIRPLVKQLMRADEVLDRVRFAAVVEAATGRRVLTYDAEQAPHRAMTAHLSQALREVVDRLGAPAHTAHQAGRINEVSRFFEEALLTVLSEDPRYACDIPKTEAGDYQRSGYPDLRIVDRETGLVAYLDPKLYAADSRQSSFRTFYFEPKSETNKILDDALHFIAGIAHDGRDPTGTWQFTGWSLVDLANFRVRLKAEFQSSNRELYQNELIIESSSPPPSDP